MLLHDIKCGYWYAIIITHSFKTSSLNCIFLVNFIMYHLLKPSVMLNVSNLINLSKSCFKISIFSQTRMRMRQINGGGGNAEDAKVEMLPEHEPSEDFNIGRPTFDSRFKELVYK
jgi:hypothetical protein